MLVIYVYSLGAIYLLHFLYQVSLDCLTTQNTQSILRVHQAIGKLLPCLYHISRLNADMGGRRNRILPLLHLLILDRQLPIRNDYFTGDTSQNRLAFGKGY